MCAFFRSSVEMPQPFLLVLAMSNACFERRKSANMTKNGRRRCASRTRGAQQDCTHVMGSCVLELASRNEIPASGLSIRRGGPACTNSTTRQTQTYLNSIPKQLERVPVGFICISERAPPDAVRCASTVFTPMPLF